MFEAYKVAVKLSLINNVSSGLVSLASQFHGLNKHIGATQGSVSALERQLLSLKKMGLIGGALTGAGAFGLSLFKGPIDAAREYETAFSRFKTLNLGLVVNQQADSFARGARVWGTSSKDLMDTLRESYGMIGSMDMAKVIAPMIASLNAANNVLFGEKASSIDGNATKSIMRFIDMRGLTNTPEQIKHGLDLAQKLVTGSGGSLKFSDLETFAKRGGTAFKSMSDEGLLYMATVMQEMGGASAGTGLMSAYQNLVAGRTTKKSMAALQELGLAKLGYVNHGNVGGKPYKTLQISDMKDAQTLRENFPLWVMKNVIPALEKRGVTNPAEQAARVNDILSNRTGSNLGVNFVTQFLQTIRDAKIVKNAMGVDQTIETAKKTTDGAVLDMHQRWRDVLNELGTTILPIAIKSVTFLTDALKGASKFAHEFPLLTKGILIAFGALSTVVAVGGTLTLATAGFKALGLALAIGGKGGGIGGMLTSVAGGLGLVTKAASVFMAAYAGWKIGTDAAEAIDNKIAKNSGYSFSSLRDFLASTGGSMFRFGKDEPLHFQQAPSKGQQMINNTIVMPDGRVLAEVVTKEQSKDARRAMNSSSSRFDGSMTPAPVGYGGRG